jgi:glycosyltransferase involved in cell wall biosynthesis
MSISTPLFPDDYGDGETHRAWPERIGILNDYVRIPYANGSSFASQFLYRELSRRGHHVTVIGPDDPDAQLDELPRHHLSLASLPMRNHPGLYLPIPTPRALARAEELRLELTLGQTGSALADLGVWLRWRQDVPLLCVNTIHLPSVYDVLLPDRLHGSAGVTAFFEERVVPFVERQWAELYNSGDGLIVLSEGLVDYWRQRGVRVPIFVIPRSVDPNIFDGSAPNDPFAARAKRGQRLLCVCRHTREKGVSRLLRIFERHVAPALPDATLTLVGDGPDHDAFVEEARQLGIDDRIFFMGERALGDIASFYRHADVFVFASLSETYGQVVSEAMWCGLPVVALADGMGVSQQIEHGVTGIAITPGRDQRQADWRFGSEVIALLLHAPRRRNIAAAARRQARRRSDPARAIARYYDAFDQARAHCEAGAAFRRAHPYRGITSVLRWSWTQMTALALGLVRPPGVVNRRQERQPGWEPPPDGWRGPPAARSRVQLGA